MNTCATRLRVPAIGLLLAACVFLSPHVTVQAGNPHGAYYSADTDKVFWFIHASDTHIGASGSTDADRLRWLVTTARTAIKPAFIVVTGDLTDSTDGNIFSYPNGPYQDEWDEYKAILSNAGVDASFYYDLPGNHDAYNDKYFAYYLANSIQGRATGKTQVSWTRVFPFGTYHFLGVNSADNTGDAFSILWPYGDYAGLDSTELSFINLELAAHSEDRLNLVFGHHPVTATGNSSDTYLYYGHQDFIDALDYHSASSYSYGHTHAASETLFKGNSYTGFMVGDGIHYYNVASLAKSSSNNYSLVAIDCNGLSSVTKTVGSWPVVLITAPVNRNIGGAVNPYAYTVPAASTNFVRALVFDTASISVVRYRIDGAATWSAMSRVAGNTALWQGTWDASTLAAGNHTIEVQATGTATVSDTITVEVVGGVTNQPPTASGDNYTTDYRTALNVPAPGVLANDSDPEGKALTAELTAGPAHGTVTLNLNGSFLYTPASDYSGSDSFTYRAYDGALYSAATTVSITIKPAPTTDTVTIKSATYTMRKQLLAVEATSTAAPTAKLEVVGFGFMTYKTKTKTYTYQVTTPSNPQSVTVKSSAGGSATKAVTQK
jgi:VCBS repeat-containing protein